MDEPPSGQARYFVATVWFLLAALKLSALDSILESSHSFLILGVTTGEAFLGFLLWNATRVRIAWILSLLFSVGLLAFAIAGPVLPSCHCLGFFVDIGARGRTALACFLVGSTLLGMVKKSNDVSYAHTNNESL